MKAGGWLVTTDKESGREIVNETFTCRHCQKIVVVPPKASPTDLGGLCRMCDKMICPACVSNGTCSPFEENMRRQAASYHARRSYGI